MDSTNIEAWGVKVPEVYISEHGEIFPEKSLSLLPV